ncbi:MAG TPA: methyltransferase domain-containing protein [Micropepsaceae bacterium]|nr:methyltransferase domain-containing protein [Micropepsaceae bacterium]
MNLGCGENPTPGWVNLDARLLPGSLFWDCRRRLPFADGSVIALYTEHMFEHFDVDSEAMPLLEECMRCLKPGGVLRIVVPDAGRYIRAYGGPWQPLVEMKGLIANGSGWRDHWLEATYETQMQVINAVFRQNYEHKYAYDEETLVLMLRRGGFSRVIRQEFGVSIDPMMAPDNLEKRNESLYVEAIK